VGPHEGRGRGSGLWPSLSPVGWRGWARGRWVQSRWGWGLPSALGCGRGAKPAPGRGHLVAA